MSTFLFKIQLPADAWNEFVGNPGPRLYEFDRQLGSQRRRVGGVAFVWPSDGVVHLVFEGREVAPGRAEAAAVAIGSVNHVVSKLYDPPSRVDEPDAWLERIRNAIPLEGDPCEGCGATYPPHLKGCRFEHSGESPQLAHADALAR